MANQYKNTVVLHSDYSNLGKKRIYVSYQDSITFKPKAVQKLYADMATDTSKYDDIVIVSNSFIPVGGILNISNLIGDTDLSINYKDTGGIDVVLNKKYSTDLSASDKIKFDALKNYAISLMV